MDAPGGGRMADKKMPEPDDASNPSDEEQRRLRGPFAAFCLLLMAGAIVLTLLSIYAGWDGSIVPVTLVIAAIALVLARIAIRW